jgi:hypothetical protein
MGRKRRRKAQKERHEKKERVCGVRKGDTF